ncbi:MAG: NUDIX domain-containing protein [bacterium]|nr:NUDIX domain-containing protein [bacterium]
MIDTSTELFDIVDENDNLLGITKPRDQVHKEMIDWHRTTGIFIVNSKKQVLCQQRSMQKDVEPGVWQPFFGGHLKAGETYIQNAIAELKEELNLTVNEKDLMNVYKVKREYYMHFSELFVYYWNGDASQLQFNDGEVEQVKWMSIQEFENLIRSKGNQDYKFNEKIHEFIDALETGESAGGVLVNNEGKIAVVSQRTSWSLPKGTIEPGEEILETAKREIYEETGISDLQLIKLLGKFDRSGINNFGKRYSKTIHIYLFKTNQTELKPIDPQNPEAIWMDKDEVSKKLSYKEDADFYESIKKEIDL